MYLTMYNFQAKYLFYTQKQKNVTRHTLSMTSYTTGMMTTVDKLRQKKNLNHEKLKDDHWRKKKKKSKVATEKR